VAIKTDTHARRYKLSRKQVLALIDKEAKKRLGITGVEFMERLRDGTLPENVAKRDIQMIAGLLDEERVQ